jgi:hypothetical protein
MNSIRILPNFRWLSFTMLIMVCCGCVSSPPQEAKKAPWTNSLGMAFADLVVCDAKILVACEETQERHLALFSGAHGCSAKSGASNPAAQVSWLEAVDFCEWLTQRERAAGVINARQHYRLPTDHEWSCAVGIGDLESPSEGPEAKTNRIKGHFPWGSVWPPPFGAGNLCGSESAGEFPGCYIACYRDALDYSYESHRKVFLRSSKRFNANCRNKLSCFSLTFARRS